MVERLSISDAELTCTQRKRFHHYRQQRIFITNLTNICERLRFVDRTMRRQFLQRDMKVLVVPPLVNVPLCNSQDAFECILRALPLEGHAFSTKARVPALMFFEAQAHPHGTDVATFLGREMDLYSESEIVVPGMEVICGAPGVSVDLTESERLGASPPEESVVIVEKLQSRLNTNIHVTPTQTVWKGEGEGMRRMAEYNKSKGVEGIVPPAAAKRDMDVEVDNNSIQLNMEDVSLDVSTLIGETLEAKAARLRAKSPYGHLPGWKLDGLIAKSNDDVRQEVFVMQMIAYYQKAFSDAKLDVWLFTYRILSTSKSTGLIQLIPNAISLDGLKKKDKYPGTLSEYFRMTYGPADSDVYKTAIKAYISSMAGYSIVSYLLSIKDRCVLTIVTWSLFCIQLTFLYHLLTQ